MQGCLKRLNFIVLTYFKRKLVNSPKKKCDIVIVF